MVNKCKKGIFAGKLFFCELRTTELGVRIATNLYATARPARKSDGVFKKIK